MKHNQILTIILFALCTELLCLALSSGPGMTKTSQRQYNPVAGGSGRDAQPKQDSAFGTKAVSQLTLKEEKHWSSPVPVGRQNDLKRDSVGGVVIDEHLQSDLTPESVVLADINAQNAGDWDTYWSLRNKMSEHPRDVSKRQPSRQQIDDGMRENIISARLENLKSVPIAVTRDLIGPARYIDTLIDPQLFYVIVDYKVRLENKYICNGPNARLYVLDSADTEWRIVQVSEPPIATLVNNGFGIGSANERELLDRQDIRMRTGQFLNLQGKVISSAMTGADILPEATNTDPNPCVRVAITTNPEGGSTNVIAIKTVPLNDYIADVLPNEWTVGDAFYDYPESLKAGAMAIKTYAWFHMIHPKGSNFDVYDSTADQVYKENSRSTNSAYVTALTATQSTGMSKSDGTIFQAQFWNGVVKVASGGANIHSGPGLSFSVINSASGGEQLTVVNGGIDTADGYRWWKIKKAGYPPPANGVGYVAGSLLLYPTNSISIDDFQKDANGVGTFVGQATQYGTKYWAYSGDGYQTDLTRFYNSTSPKTNFQNIRFFSINVGSCSTLTINAVTPTTTQTLDWGLSSTYTISVVDNNGSPVSGSTVNVSDGVQSFSTFTSPTNSSGQTTYTTTVPSGKADGTYDVAFAATKSGYISSSSVTRQVQVRHNVCSVPAATTSVGGILNGAVNANDCTPTPTASLTSRSVSSTNVLVNQPFTVSTTLSVSNATADHAGISISFPSLTNSGVAGTPPNESYNSTQGTVTTASSSSITGGSILQYYGSGESLTCGSSSTCPAQHLLVEGDWVTVGAGNTRSLNLTVTPKVVGTFKVRIRGWVTAPGYQNPSRDPSSGSVDQQSFPVYEVTVNVSATPTDSSVQFSSATYSVNEDGGSKTITVTRTGGTNAFVVNYATSNGTATAGADYVGLNEVLSFATNETSKTFTVPIINDTLVEGNETLNLSLSNPSGGVTLGSPSTAVLTIVDNDTACTYSISESEHTLSPDLNLVNFFMDAPSGCAWTAVSDSPSWLTTSSSGSGHGTISYQAAVNPSSNPRVGHITVGGQVHTVTQIGVGGAGNVRFSSVTYASNEGGGDATITVTRTGGTGSGSVQYSTSNGTATAGTDYVSASGTLLFGENETSKSFNVTILDDATFEGDESFNLLLKNNSSSFTLGNPSTATLTIVDNDSPPDSTGPSLSINSHGNGDTVSNSTITLSGTASDSSRGDSGISSVTVNGAAASGGTASGSGTANWSRTLTLSQGANNITVVARDNSSNQNTTTQSITLYYQPTQTYTIAVSASPSAGGTVGGDGTFAAGSTRTVTASANSGYSFANWTENGSMVSSSASYTFTLNGNRTLVANFSIVSNGNAAYDSTLKAPKCPAPGSVCDSGTLINGRGNITGGAEPNQPNTIYSSCADNTVGSYHSDESIDNIKVSTLDGSSFAPGKTVKIEVTVWAVSTDDFLDLFFAADAANPNWDYITSLTPSVTGAQVLSTTFTLPPGGSLQAVRANFLYKGELSICSSGSDSYEDHDDLAFAVGSGATQSIQLLLEEVGPSPSQAAAVDAMFLLRDPFLVANEANLFNLGLDRNTRVIIFVTNLQLTQGETSSSVVVNLIDSSGHSYDIAAEDVRPVPNFNFTQVIFRLSDNLPVGTCTIKIKAHGQVSNVGTIRIRI